MKRIYEFFEAGDLDSILAAVATDVVWDHSGPPGNPLNRVFNGRAGVREFFETLGQTIVS